uniref:Uncharacterized protein n=1 Tax=Cacopsylla melanoneura TaxID=428564 RepID=A0A8D8QKV0_9HEMI
MYSVRPEQRPPTRLNHPHHLNHFDLDHPQHEDYDYLLLLRRYFDSLHFQPEDHPLLLLLLLPNDGSFVALYSVGTLHLNLIHYHFLQEVQQQIVDYHQQGKVAPHKAHVLHLQQKLDLNVLALVMTALLVENL